MPTQIADKKRRMSTHRRARDIARPKAAPHRSRPRAPPPAGRCRRQKRTAARWLPRSASTKRIWRGAGSSSGSPRTTVRCSGSLRTGHPVSRLRSRANSTTGNSRSRPPGLSSRTLRANRNMPLAGSAATAGIHPGRLHSGRLCRRDQNWGVVYFEDRLIVGWVHDRINLPFKWYIGSYVEMQRLVRIYLRREFKNAAFVREPRRRSSRSSTTTCRRSAIRSC